MALDFIAVLKEAVEEADAEADQKLRRAIYQRARQTLLRNTSDRQIETGKLLLGFESAVIEVEAYFAALERSVPQRSEIDFDENGDDVAELQPDYSEDLVGQTTITPEFPAVARDGVLTASVSDEQVERVSLEPEIAAQNEKTEPLEANARSEKLAVPLPPFAKGKSLSAINAETSAPVTEASAADSEPANPKTLVDPTPALEPVPDEHADKPDLPPINAVEQPAQLGTEESEEEGLDYEEYWEEPQSTSWLLPVLAVAFAASIVLNAVLAYFALWPNHEAGTGQSTAPVAATDDFLGPGWRLIDIDVDVLSPRASGGLFGGDGSNIRPHALTDDSSTRLGRASSPIDEGAARDGIFAAVNLEKSDRRLSQFALVQIVYPLTERAVTYGAIVDLLTGDIARHGDSPGGEITVVDDNDSWRIGITAPKPQGVLYGKPLLEIYPAASINFRSLDPRGTGTVTVTGIRIQGL